MSLIIGRKTENYRRLNPSTSNTFHLPHLGKEFLFILTVIQLDSHWDIDFSNNTQSHVTFSHSEKE